MKGYLYFVLISLICAITVQAQSDIDKINEARTALEKYNDCNVALKALQEVSKEGQQETMYIYYVAKASESCKMYEQAIEYYIKYAQIVPGKAEISDKISQLKYEFRKEQEKTNETVNTLKPYLGKWALKKLNDSYTLKGYITITADSNSQPLVTGNFISKKIDNPGQQNEKIEVFKGQINESTVIGQNNFGKGKGAAYMYFGDINHSKTYTNEKYARKNNLVIYDNSASGVILIFFPKKNLIDNIEELEVGFLYDESYHTTTFVKAP